VSRRPPRTLNVALAVLVLAAGAVVLATSLLGGDDGGSTAVSTSASANPRSEQSAEGRERQAFFPSDLERSFARFARTQPGRVDLALAPLGRGPVRLLGSKFAGHAWSAMKVPLLVALLREAGGPTGLSPAQRRQAEAALTRSDNDAAIALFDELQRRRGGLNGASAAIERVLRRVGDNATKVNTLPNDEGFTTFGQTGWSATQATLFFRALARGCLLDREGTGYVLRTMRDVVADQRWGLGDAGLPAGTRVALKGGWGPEQRDAYLVRQSGIVGSGATGYVVTIVARPSGRGEASFATGREINSAAARWIRSTLGTVRPQPPAACARSWAPPAGSAQDSGPEPLARVPSRDELLGQDQHHRGLLSNGAKTAAIAASNTH